jgi:hypothetical protein
MFGTLLSGIADIGGLISGNQQADRNYELQKRQFQYQQELNRIQMEREDTAYQRKAADLIAAGFNKNMAVEGSGSQSAPSKVGEAPQHSRDYDYSSRVIQAMTARQMMADYSMTKAQELYLKQQRLQSLAATRLDNASARRQEIDNIKWENIPFSPSDSTISRTGGRIVQLFKNEYEHRGLGRWLAELRFGKEAVDAEYARKARSSKKR